MSLRLVRSPLAPKITTAHSGACRSKRSGSWNGLSLAIEPKIACRAERAAYNRAMALTILGIPGSLRKASINRALLRAAIELAPSDVTIEPFDLSAITPYNGDEELNPPASVRHLKARIRAADGVLFSTPEYNYSIPGV